MTLFELVSMAVSSPVTIALSSVFITMFGLFIITQLKRQLRRTTILEGRIVHAEQRAKGEFDYLLDEMEREGVIRKEERDKVSDRVFDELIERQLKSINGKSVAEGRTTQLDSMVGEITSNIFQSKQSSDSITSSIPEMRTQLARDIPGIVEDINRSIVLSDTNSSIVDRVERSTVDIRHQVQATQSRLGAINRVFGGGN